MFILYSHWSSRFFCGSLVHQITQSKASLSSERNDFLAHLKLFLFLPSLYFFRNLSKQGLQFSNRYIRYIHKSL